MSFFSKIPKIGILSIFLALCLLYGNDSVLYDQDEAAYSGFAKTMLTKGDYVTMEFPFSEPHRKPPLHFWLTSISYQVLGVSEFSLRLLPAVWILAICLLTYDLTKRLYNEKTAIYSFLILATSVYFPLNGKIALVDGLLTFLQTLGFYSLFRILLQNKDRVGAWIFLFWFSVSMGCLTKGPPILIFLGGICFVFLFYKKTRKVIFLLRPWFFLPLALLPLLFWGYLAWQNTNGELIRWMIDWYILRRAADPVFGQSGPPGTYLLLFFITLFPWSFYLPSAFIRTIRTIKEVYIAWRYEKEEFSEFPSLTENKMSLSILFLSGLCFGWIFYELLMSKLPSYPLAAYPILAVLIASSMERSESLTFWKKWIPRLAVLQTISIVTVFLPLFSEKRRDSYRAAESWNQFLKQGDTVVSIKNYALPSLAYYLNAEIREQTDLQLIQTLPSGTILLLDQETFYFLNLLGIQGEALGKEKTIWAYDRDKTLTLLLFKIR
ncbi:phospholipid carrier-dependent glycosyltransferase [Leptospira idonii]|uniref:Phospholipid carrier-dependent glycosyltransferase n=1 Tax=Leptospira idonii TaxID=1193500 RepID=A0A4R9LYA2_9LEPT|nr:phospholipid carrier-dependent glycosyltransferase [Leptospira idonii]